MKLKVTQLYTNRSLSYSIVGDHQRALEDAEHVLKELDHSNAKALFRRAMANKNFKKIEEALKDLKALFK